MNSVGIDISKGRSTVAVMRPFGEVVISPFEVHHTDSELSALARRLKSLNGETRVVMEATGNYHAPVVKLLHNAGLYVSVVNAKLVHGYGNNDLRRVKTDKKILSSWQITALTAGSLCRGTFQRKIPGCC